MARKSSSDVPAVVEEWWEALKPFVNPLSCGHWTEYDDENGKHHAHPSHSITQEQWSILGRYRAGEADLTYRNNPFKPAQMFAAALRPKQIEQSTKGEKAYFTSGRKGLALMYIDVDEHHEWQTDAADIAKLIQDVLGEGVSFLNQSGRGCNLFVKVDYSESNADHPGRQEGWRLVNEEFAALGESLNRLVKSQGYLADVEVKGSITRSKTAYGTLAKLPSYKNPSLERANEFAGLPVLSLNEVRVLHAKIDAMTDQAKADVAIAECERRKGKKVAEPKQKSGKRSRISSSGSVSGFIVQDDDLAVR